MSSVTNPTNQRLDTTCKQHSFLGKDSPEKNDNLYGYNSNIGPEEKTQKHKIGPSQKKIAHIKEGYSLKKSISNFSSKVKQCGKPIDISVGVTQLGFTNLSTCKDKLCPHCLQISEEKHKKKIREIIEKSFLEGFKIMFLTFTHKHNKKEKYENLRDEIVKCFTAITRSSKYKKLEEKYDIKAYIKKLETTFQLTNGFHNHIHLLLIFNSDEDTTKLIDAFYEMWENQHSKKFGKKLSKQCFKSMSIINEVGISRYMAKSWSISDEISSSSKKNGKGIHPIFLIKKYEETGNKKYLSAFLEYDSSSGKKSITYSQQINRIFELETLIKHDEINPIDSKIEISRELNKVIFNINKSLYKVIAYNNLESDIIEIINLFYNSEDDYWKTIYHVKIFLDSEIPSYDVSFTEGIFYLTQYNYTFESS